ncbi:translation initiation factor 5B, partial [Phenoliferia sp. Uapishka_3]
MASFGALYVVGGARVLFSYGIYTGGPAALWSSMLITVYEASSGSQLTRLWLILLHSCSVLMTITAASLAEICSSIPLSGSIYIWAAEAGGRKYGRFFGFVVAFWSTTAWTSFVASNTQATTNFMLSELTVFNRSIPGDFDDTQVKWRAIVWACSEVFLLLAILTNLMPPNRFSLIFKASALIIFIDFALTVIWLPIGVSKTYGFQTKEFVFTKVYNGSGASDGWNWILSFLSTSGVLTGFDAAGHIAEETINASLTAARGIFWSCAVSGILAFPLIILFLFCSPPLEVLFGIDAPQPFVTIYAMALGRGGQMVMTLVAIIGLFVNTSLAITAASRLVFAVARDGILPGSKWIGKVDANGQPRNAIIFIGIVSSILLCSILPSAVAFTSLVSAGGVPTIAAYALIPILRLTFTRGDFANAKWSNGRFSTPFCVIAAIWNTFLLTVLFSPYEFPVNAQNFNFSCVIFGVVTIAGMVSWWCVPEEAWLSRRNVGKVLDVVEGKDLAPGSSSSSQTPSQTPGGKRDHED